MTNDPIISSFIKFAITSCKASELLRERKRLLSIIESTKNECGSCSFWMTKDCPKEVRKNGGFFAGQAYNDFRCEKFTIKHLRKEFIKSTQAKISDIDNQIKILAAMEGK